MQLTPLKFHAIIGILKLEQNLTVLLKKTNKQKNHALLHQTQQSGEMF